MPGKAKHLPSTEGKLLLRSENSVRIASETCAARVFLVQVSK